MLRQLALVALFSLSLLPSLASAQSSRLRTGGMNLEMFRPAIDSRGHLTINGTDIMPENRLSFGLVLDAGFNVLQFDGGVNDNLEEGGRTDHIVDQAITGTILVNVGIANWAVVGIQVPIQVMNGEAVSIPGSYGWADPASNPIRGLSYQGLGDISIHGKVRLLRAERDPVGLAVVARIGLPTGNDSRFAGDPSVSLWPSVVMEARTSPDQSFNGLSRIRFSLEFGYRAVFGDGASFPIYGETNVRGMTNGLVSDYVLDSGTNLRYDDLMTFGAGASFRLARTLDLVTEVYGTQIASEIGTRGALSLEALVGFKLFVQSHSYLMLGGGAGIPTNPDGRGFQSAQWRAMLAFIYEPPIGDRDGDGIMDDIDDCPNDPEDFDEFLDEDGCPELDNDNDGILDDVDDCPMIPEDQDGDNDDDGCPEGNDSDRDGDGITDDVDQCPDQAEDRDQFQDDDGCPDLDNDEDGILDTEDLCPNDPEDIDAFDDADGCPDLDNDHDRILDNDDQCPDEPEVYNGTEDQDGCPDEGSVIFDDNSLIILDKIYFETNSAQILSRSFAILDAVAATLIGNPQIRLIEVQGHADERGNDAHNLQLTQDRAASVVEALVQRNVPRDRLRSAGYGELCPVNPASNRAAYEENRRVEFKVIETDEGPTGVQVACDAAANLHQR
ncbi:MAG: OmpA family protein [Sandaracinaceae bacterium]|jgi:OOP family OmpA-OmpF porin|nr:OmpA family protein [Sandaracinaceae bacterium]MBP7682385.1 OmpA family protein [Deltaproteobacteria bacterium]MBK6810781.1 OmpA family protein [Sandaracinaceae bacterium]MBK7154486.1 OmpA family protein [Sandaracinaceae bacterium]MBK7775618.1 OmpA family protein [Sandaracinaceae bacterium]